MRALLDLVMPAECAGCGRGGALVCAACRAPLLVPAALSWPTPSPPGLPPPYSVAAYDGAVRALLLAHKEHGMSAPARPLAAALASSVVAAAHGRPGPVVLVPAPSSPQARRRRGVDVVAALTRAAARQLRATGRHVDVVVALAHRRPVLDSAGLSAADRSANLAGAFGLRRRAARALDGAVVVLTDDLVTTGATLAEAAGALRAVGATVVAAATVAATRRHP